MSRFQDERNPQPAEDFHHQFAHALKRAEDDGDLSRTDAIMCETASGSGAGWETASGDIADQEPLDARADHFDFARLPRRGENLDVKPRPLTPDP